MEELMNVVEIIVMVVAAVSCVICLVRAFRLHHCEHNCEAYTYAVLAIAIAFMLSIAIAFSCQTAQISTAKQDIADGYSIYLNGAQVDTSKVDLDSGRYSIKIQNDEKQILLTTR